MSDFQNIGTGPFSVSFWRKRGGSHELIIKDFTMGRNPRRPKMKIRGKKRRHKVRINLSEEVKK